MRRFYCVYHLSRQKGIYSQIPKVAIVEAEKAQIKLIEEALKEKERVEDMDIWVKVVFYAEEELTVDNCKVCVDCGNIFPEAYINYSSDVCFCGGNLELRYIGGLKW